MKKQHITYIVHLPVIGESVTISGIPVTFHVYQIESEIPPYDSVLIKNIDRGDVSRLVITNGEWQVEHFNIPHEITFSDATPISHKIISTIPQQITPTILRTPPIPQKKNISNNS